MPKIFVSGHRGMVGSALVRALRAQNSENQLLLADRTELDLLNQAAVEGFIEKHQPDIVINAAAKVGGIHANDTYPAEFIHQNLLINSNLIHAAWQSGVGRFLNLGSSCIPPCLPTADQGGISAYWYAGENKRGLCFGQNYWTGNVQALPESVRSTFS